MNALLARAEIAQLQKVFQAKTMECEALRRITAVLVRSIVAGESSEIFAQDGKVAILRSATDNAGKAYTLDVKPGMRRAVDSQEGEGDPVVIIEARLKTEKDTNGLAVPKPKLHLPGDVA